MKWLRKAWHDSVLSKVIAGVILAGLGSLYLLLRPTLIEKSEVFRREVELSIWQLSFALLLLIPANIWWLWRLIKAIFAKFKKSSDLQILPVSKQTKTPTNVVTVDEESNSDSIEVEFDPDDTDKRLLAFLFKTKQPIWKQAIDDHFGAEFEQEIDFRLSRLVRYQYIRKPPDAIHQSRNEPLGYHLTSKGQEFVIKNGIHKTDKLLHDVSIKILQAFAEANETVLSEYVIRTWVNVDATTFDYYFSEVQDSGYLIFIHHDSVEGSCYELTQKARRFLLKERT